MRHAWGPRLSPLWMPPSIELSLRPFVVVYQHSEYIRVSEELLGRLRVRMMAPHQTARSHQDVCFISDCTLQLRNGGLV